MTRGSFSAKTDHSIVLAGLTDHSVAAITQIARIKDGSAPRVIPAADRRAIP
jgi:hypothetical protein